MTEVEEKMRTGGFGGKTHHKTGAEKQDSRKSTRQSQARPAHGIGRAQLSCRASTTVMPVSFQVGIVTLTGASHSLANSAPMSGRHARTLPNCPSSNHSGLTAA